MKNYTQFLSFFDGLLTFQTFDDQGKRRDLAQIMHGSAHGCARDLMKLNNAGAGVFITVNETDGNVIYSGPVICLAGKDRITEPVGNLSLEMSAAGFSQLNSHVAGAMYDYARKETPHAKIVWDLYCGLGGLGLTVAIGRNIQLFGIDTANDVIRLAEMNAVNAGVTARYPSADLSSGLPLDWPQPDTVLVNPPRRGLDDLLKNFLIKVQPRQVIYMSCSPESFARDAVIREHYETGVVLFSE